MSTPKVLILGIGNILWADEGFGVRVVQALQKRYQFPAQISLLDGGTQGLALMPYVQESDAMLIVDAVDFQLPAGTLVELRDGDVPAYLGAKTMSLHQVSFQEVLALCQLLGSCPKQLCLIGLQPAVLEDFGGSLSMEAKTQMEPAIQKILGYLEILGLAATPRPITIPSGTTSLDMDRYEQQRPPAELACRIGDARFLNLRGSD